ncbi:hypothetical protein TRVA0_014S01574 [Trichomonascus vanleenenianus]|uniref:uncharacterized protein n=1 Tax=Trichomonascus vanleenenianus TaxID=2268995 RepID=UPI003ECA2A50
MSLKKTESTISLREKKFPFWDSSDPNRNPPPMPINPEPSLRTTPQLSPTKSNNSPTRMFHSRTLSSLGDDHMLELLDLSKELKAQTQSVEVAVKEALIEFGALAHRSRDNAVALSDLRDRAKRTEENTAETESFLKESINHIASALDTHKESQRALSTVVDALLDSTKDVSRKLQGFDANMKKLVSGDNGNGQDGELKRHMLNIAKQIDERHNSLLNGLSELQLNLSKEPDTSTYGNEEVKELILELVHRIDSQPGLDVVINKLDLVSENSADVSRKVEEAVGNGSDNSRQVIAKLDANGNALKSLTSELSSYSRLLEQIDQKLEGNGAVKGQQESVLMMESTLHKLKEMLSSSNVTMTDHGKALEDLSSKKDLLNLQDKLEELKATLNSQVLALPELKAQIAASNATVMDKDTLSTHLETLQSQVESRTDQLAESHTALLGALERLSNEKLSCLDEKVSVLSSLDAKLDKLRAAIPDDVLSELKEDLSSSTQESAKSISEIKADVQSLIDFQYGDMRGFGKQIGEILSKLSRLESQDKDKKYLDQVEKQRDEAAKQLEAAQARIAELENTLASTIDNEKRSQQRIHELELKLKEKEGELTVLGYQAKDIAKNEERKTEIEVQVESLSAEKLKLTELLQTIKAQISVSVEGLSTIEKRAEQFERRLNDTILDRSKGILGSTAMTLITSSATAERKPLRSANGSKRNLSLAPAIDCDETAEEDDQITPFDKENEIAISKRRNMIKGRSVSLFDKQ